MTIVKVYLDQNVYGHLLSHGDWRTHPIANALLSAQSAGVAEVWASPTHVIELSQASDLALRTKLAQIMLELSGGRRMTAGPDMALIELFGQYVNDVVPGAFDRHPYLERYVDTAQRIWIGYLALLASDYPVELGPGASEIRRMKIESQLIHARIAADPDASIAAIVQSVARFATTTDPDPLGFTALTDAQIENEIAVLRKQQKAPSNATIKKLQRHRADICAAYGAVDIGGALQNVFGQFPLDLELTFNTPAIVAAWNPTMLKVPPLPTSIIQAAPTAQRMDRSIVVTVLNSLIRAAAHAGLVVATAGYYSLMRELEICLNNKKLPTPGATLDVDHATSAMLFDVIVCHDVLLANNLKSYVASSRPNVHVVSDAVQLKKAIAASGESV